MAYKCFLLACCCCTLCTVVEVAAVLQVAVLAVAPHLAGADPLHRGLHGHLLRLQVMITLIFIPHTLGFELSFWYFYKILPHGVQVLPLCGPPDGVWEADPVVPPAEHRWGSCSWPVLCCRALQYSTVQYSIVQYSTVQYRTMDYGPAHQNSTVQYSTVQYSTGPWASSSECHQQLPLSRLGCHHRL